MIPGEEQDEVPWTADAVLEYINSFESPVDAMQNIADTWNYRNEALDNAIANRDAAEIEADKLRVERNMLRKLAKALVGSWPPLGDNYECLYCRHTRYLCDPANHEPDCPWRVAAEYIERLEAQDVATD